MHIAAAVAVGTERLLPAIDQLVIARCGRLEEENAGVVKSGRTHLQDAVPISFSQEISGWRGLLEGATQELLAAMGASASPGARRHRGGNGPQRPRGL